MADEIIGRAEARARGLKRYFTGARCKYGHISERLVSSGVCIACRADIEQRYNARHPEKIKEKRRAQAARYREENPDRILRNQQKWRSQNREREYQRTKQWRVENPQRRREQERRQYVVNREEKLEKHRKWRDGARHDEKFKRKAIARVKRWIELNPEKKREQARKGSHARRAKMYQAGGSYTNEEIRDLLEGQNWICAEVTCRADLRVGKELDHIIPISKGGPNHIGNLQWLCITCNRQKSDMLPDEWAAHRRQLIERKSICPTTTTP